MSFYAGAKRQSGLDNPADEQVGPAPVAANPHNPAFVTQVPWYANMGDAAGPLDHQKARNNSSSQSSSSVPIGDAYTKRGTIEGVKLKFLPGACINCGATTHVKRDCLERPRKVGAKYTGEALANDDIVPIEIGRDAFESKRDRWRGFAAEEHVGAAVESQADTRFKRAELRAQYVLGLIEESEFEKKMKELDKDEKPNSGELSTAANLRVREDTAKYLLNLDVNSAFYDPKSRSMREDPFAKDSTYRGDNFERFSGETSAAMQARAFAWDSSNAGKEVHEVANPTETSKQVAEHRREMERRKKELHDKYNFS